MRVEFSQNSFMHYSKNLSLQKIFNIANIFNHHAVPPSWLSSAHSSWEAMGYSSLTKLQETGHLEGYSYSSLSSLAPPPIVHKLSLLSPALLLPETSNSNPFTFLGVLVFFLEMLESSYILQLFDSSTTYSPCYQLILNLTSPIKDCLGGLQHF